jgi:hypothetical protein
MLSRTSGYISSWPILPLIRVWKSCQYIPGRRTTRSVKSIERHSRLFIPFDEDVYRLAGLLTNRTTVSRSKITFWIPSRSRAISGYLGSLSSDEPVQHMEGQVFHLSRIRWDLSTWSDRKETRRTQELLNSREYAENLQSSLCATRSYSIRLIEHPRAIWDNPLATYP